MSAANVVSKEFMVFRAYGKIACALTAFCSLFFSHPRAVASQTTNLERLQAGAEVLGDSLLTSLSGNDSREVCVRVVDHPASWIVEQAIMRLMEEQGFTRVPCAPLPPNDLLVAITNIGVRYVELDDADFFRREITLGLSASVPKRQTSTAAVRHVTETREIVLLDTIETAQTSLLEVPGYSFTVGTKIQRNRSGIWSKLVEPAVVIGSAVVMVVLLFTTRSQ